MQKMKQAAAEFLAGKRVAVTGVSRNRGGSRSSSNQPEAPAIAPAVLSSAAIRLWLPGIDGRDDAGPAIRADPWPAMCEMLANLPRPGRRSQGRPGRGSWV